MDRTAIRMGLRLTSALVALGVAAIVPAAAQTAKPKLLIGDLSAQSGPGGGSVVTDSTMRAVETAVRDLNAKGGVKVKDKTYEFAYKAVDTRSEPAATLAASKEIIGDGAIAAVLPGLATEVAMRSLADAKVFNFGAAPRVTNPLLTEGPEKHPYLFGVIELAQPVIAGWMGGILAQNPNVKRVAVLNFTDPTGKFMDMAVQQAAKKYGLEYVGAEFVDITTTDFSTPLTSLKAKNPDIIYVGTATQVLAASRQAIQLKAAPILWNYSMRPVDLKHVGPLGGTTIILADFRAPFTEGLTPPEYTDAMTKFGKLKSGEPLQAGISAAYYDWLHLLARAIEKAGTIDDRMAIVKALEGMSYDGPFGRTEVLPNHTTRGPIGLIAAKADTVTLQVYKDSDSTREKPISQLTVKNTWSQ